MFTGSLAELENPGAFQKLLNDLYSKKWITYCKRPFGGPEKVLEYLGRYTHRVAISNNRIKTMDDGKVVFELKDYRDNNKRKQMEITAVEFIRRFMLHILPENFYKIRYYGILSSRRKQKDIARCREILGRDENTKPLKAGTIICKDKQTANEQRFAEWQKCPNCKVGTMHISRLCILSGIKIRAA